MHESHHFHPYLWYCTEGVHRERIELAACSSQLRLLNLWYSYFDYIQNAVLEEVGRILKLVRILNLKTCVGM